MDRVWILYEKVKYLTLDFTGFHVFLNSFPTKKRGWAESDPPVH